MSSTGRVLAKAAQEHRAEIRSRRNGSARGTIIAEGDSWIEYPRHNLRSELEALGWDVFSVASNGDQLESMVYDPGQQEKLARAFDKCADRGENVLAVFVSAGGNDTMGDPLALILNHSASGLETLNWKILDGLFERLEEAYADMKDAIDANAERYLGRRVPVVVHGYDAVYPTGDGYLGGWGPLPGPWLRPHFERRGYAGDLWFERNTRVLLDLLNRWNNTLSGLADRLGMTYVDLRGTLRPNQWADELHPNQEGFALLAQKIDGALLSAIGGDA